uniref:Ribosomal protein S10 n=1 Tax=Naegleria gruberi TaxID=5762 RepID=Q9G8Q8_NAEGR|nr:ribosomal protein S10 [Naegleria gruberi]AAG17796.1 ribosomal protein S10 [Naegleria gruberi]
MFFFNKNSLYRIGFLFFFIFKKKKLGYKKVQWKLSSYFHVNRIKYFFYFLKKIFMYKKFFLFFFLKRLFTNLFVQLKSIYSFLVLKKENYNIINYSNFFTKESFFSDSFNILKNKNNLNFNFNNLFSIYYTMLFAKLFFFMFKSANLSYFSLPIKKNKYTILRSPHIDKKSREQFELKHSYLVLNELSLFSFANNMFLFNSFKFFINNFKLEEKTDSLYN